MVQVRSEVCNLEGHLGTEAQLQRLRWLLQVGQLCVSHGQERLLVAQSQALDLGRILSFGESRLDCAISEILRGSGSHAAQSQAYGGQIRGASRGAIFSQGELCAT